VCGDYRPETGGRQMMTLEDLAREVEMMRSLQRKYFKTRDTTTLRECKDRERRVDAAVEEILHPNQQKEMF
jgi:hypothetical protein